MGFTFVQTAQQDSPMGVVSNTLTLPAAPLQGNLVCLSVATDSNLLQNLTITDGASNAYDLVGVVVASPTPFAIYLYCLNAVPVGASNTIVVSWNATSTAVSVTATEFSSDGPILFDNLMTQSAGVGSGVTLSGPSLTTQQGQLIYAAASVTNGTILAPNVGGVLNGWIGAGLSTEVGCCTAYRLSSDSGLNTPSYSDTFSGDGFIGIAAAFKSDF